MGTIANLLLGSVASNASSWDEMSTWESVPTSLAVATLVCNVVFLVASVIISASLCRKYYRLVYFLK